MDPLTVSQTTAAVIAAIAQMPELQAALRRSLARCRDPRHRGYAARACVRGYFLGEAPLARALIHAGTTVVDWDRVAMEFVP